MNTLSELTAATKLKPKRGEDDDDFRKRLVEAVSDLDDKTYGKLSKPTRTWADDAIETFNETGKVPVFGEDDDEEDEAAAAEDDDEEEDVGKGKNKKLGKKKKVSAKDEEEEDEEEQRDEEQDVADDEDAVETEEDEDMTHTDTDRGSSRRSVKKGAAKSAASGKNSGKKKVAAGRKADGKTGGGQTKLKQILARDPDMSIDDLEAKLKKQGHEMSRMTLSTQRSGFRHTVKVLQEAGLLKKTLIG